MINISKTKPIKFVSLLLAANYKIYFLKISNFFSGINLDQKPILRKPVYSLYDNYVGQAEKEIANLGLLSL